MLAFSFLESMPRAELLRRLAGLTPPTPAACLVLLWTYFRHDKVGLSDVEDRIGSEYKHVLKLPGLNLSGKGSGGLSAAVRDLLACDSERFDVRALQLLKGLDTLLNDGDPRDFGSAELPGIDGELYLVRPRNAFVARRWDLTWERRQGLSLAAYCGNFTVVPAHPVQGLRIEICSSPSWRNTYLQDRLRWERNRFKVMLWPFECAFDYPALREMKKKPPPLHVTLDALDNEPALQEEVERALEEARRQEVTLLILPELSIPPATAVKIHERLVGQGVDGYPILTLFGCSHRRNQRGDLDVNEAVLLGPDGSELHRHAKLAPFTDYAEGEEHPCGENLERGKTVTILECSIGNITPLICLDLLNTTVADILGRSHGNLLAVPSLSPQTSAHQTAARALQPRLRACTFVCNHWNGDPPGHRTTSFFQIPAKNGLQFHIHPAASKADKPYLLFPQEPEK